MKTLVAYYSRSKVTKKVINKIEEEFDCDIEEITTTVNYGGALGYARGGKDAITGKIVPINPTKYNPSEYDVVILAGPVWASKIANPVLSYVDENKDKLPDIKFLITAKSSGFEGASEQLAELAGKKPIKEVFITQREVGKELYLDKLNEFLS